MRKRTGIIFSLIFAFSMVIGTISADWGIEKEVPGSTTGILTPVTGENAVAFFGSRYFTTIESAVNAANSVATSSNKINVIVIPKINSGNDINNPAIYITSDLTIGNYVSLTISMSTTEVNTPTYNSGKTSITNDSTSYLHLINGDSKTNGTIDFADSNLDHVKAYLKNHVGLGDSTHQVTLTISQYGKLNIGGSIGYNGQNLSSHTSGSYAQLTVGSNSHIISNGEINCFGYIKESSNNNGSTISINNGFIKIPFVIRDFRGGSYCARAYNTDSNFPFQIFEFPNNQIKTTISENASMYCFATLYASGHNFDEAKMVSSSSAPFLIERGNFEIKYTPVSWPYTTVNSTKGTTKIIVDGKTSLQPMTMSVAGTKIETSKMLFPFSYKFDIEIKSGSTLTVSTPIKMLCGSKLTICEDSEVMVNSKLIAYSNSYVPNITTAGSGWYPTTHTSAEIINNGTLYLNNAFGGVIKSNRDGSVINSSSSFVNSVTSVETLTGASYGLSGTNESHTETAYLDKIIYGTSTKNIVSSEAIVYDTDHWDGPRSIYNIEYINVCNDESFDSTNVTNNNSTKVSNSSINLSAPTYNTDDFSFASFYFDEEMTTPIAVDTNVSVSNLISEIVANNHTLTIYVKWINNNAPKASYCVGYYENNVLKYGDTIVLPVGETVNLSSTADVSNYYSGSKVYTYSFVEWTYSLNGGSATSLGGNTYTLANENDSVVFIPTYTIHEYSYPSITLTSSNTGSVAGGGSSTITATVSNYNATVFDYSFSWNCESSRDVTLTPNNNPTINGTTATYTATFKNNESSGSSNGNATISFNFTFKIKGTNDEAISIPKTYTQKITYSCLVEGTTIRMADGSSKAIEDIVAGDLVMVFNHETGQYQPMPIIFNNHSNQKSEEYDVLTLEFDNGRTLELVQDHGLFDSTLRKYVFINQDNFADYIGHRFITSYDGFTNGTTILINGFVETKDVRIFSPISYFYMNILANDMLTVGPPVTEDGRIIEGFVNYFEFNDDASWNKEAMQHDLSVYGTYSPQDFENYISEEAFWSSPGVYLKVAVGKGIMSYQDIIDVIVYLLNRNLIDADLGSGV